MHRGFDYAPHLVPPRRPPEYVTVHVGKPLRSLRLINLIDQHHQVLIVVLGMAAESIKRFSHRGRLSYLDVELSLSGCAQGFLICIEEDKRAELLRTSYEAIEHPDLLRVVRVSMRPEYVRTLSLPLTWILDAGEVCREKSSFLLDKN